MARPKMPSSVPPRDANVKLGGNLRWRLRVQDRSLELWESADQSQPVAIIAGMVRPGLKVESGLALDPSQALELYVRLRSVLHHQGLVDDNGHVNG